MSAIFDYFYFDRLSLIMMSLIGLVSLCVGLFALRYLQGDRKKREFYILLSILLVSVCLLVSADHLLLFLGAWLCSNYCLTRLMVHKKEWQAAAASGQLAQKNFTLGAIFLATAFLLLYISTGLTSIQDILNRTLGQITIISSGIFILLAAMTQSALWPFHRWLISSLNSPTPVSAVMHAGLVNGGGFILARFGGIFLQEPWLLHSIFAVGCFTALTGTLWKLMQSDIKRMLACSTMGQMGWMAAQCGLGLFPAAISHLCCHGLFKAYLFLSTGSAAQEKRLDLDYPPSAFEFIKATLCGVAGTLVFCVIGDKNILALDTSIFLIWICLLAGIQFALPIIRSHIRLSLLTGLVSTILCGAIYGLLMAFAEYLLTPLQLSKPLSLNSLHIIALIILTTSWLAIIFIKSPTNRRAYPNWQLRCYVTMLNASQPHAKTMTASRNQYQY